MLHKAKRFTVLWLAIFLLLQTVLPFTALATHRVLTAPGAVEVVINIDSSSDDLRMEFARAQEYSISGSVRDDQLSEGSVELGSNTEFRYQFSMALAIGGAVCSTASDQNRITFTLYSGSDVVDTETRVICRTDYRFGFNEHFEFDMVDTGTVEEEVSTGSMEIDFAYIQSNGDDYTDYRFHPSGIEFTLTGPDGYSISQANFNDFDLTGTSLRVNELEFGTYELQATLNPTTEDCIRNRQHPTCDSFEPITLSEDFTISASDPDYTNTQNVAILTQPASLQDDDGSLVEEESNCSGLALSYILCPIIESLFWGVRQVYLLFVGQLDVEPLRFGEGANEAQQALYNVWNSFRVIANILFVGVFLLAIFGQAFSWFFTPYELKRIIPRLAIAVIITQLSWFIAGFLIDVFNTLGGGVKALILGPVSGMQSIDFDFINWMGDAIVGVILGTGALQGFRLIGGLTGIGYLFPIIMLPIAVFLFFSLLFVIARQILISILVIISPIVFVLWTLPGTQKVWSSWWEYTLKALLMYPLIIALITSGELLGKLAVAGSDTVGGLQFAGILAFFAPYFLIPYTFSLAGGILASLTGSMGSLRKRLDNQIFGKPEDRGSWRGKAREKRMIKAQTRLSRQRVRFDSRTVKGSYDSDGNFIKGYNAGGPRPKALAAAYRSRRDDLKKRAEAKPNSISGRLAQGFGLGSLSVAAFGGVGLSIPARIFYSTIDRPSFLLKTALIQPWENQLSAETIQAKKTIDMLVGYGNDEYVFALFGDYDPITGERFSSDAINVAKKYRHHHAILNAGLKYIFTQPTSRAFKQAWVNKFATYNPFAQGADDMSTLSKDKKAKAGMWRQYTEYESLKKGTWKGATFGTQNLARDARFRDYNVKMRDVYEYDEDSGEYVVVNANDSETSPDYGAITEKGFDEFLNELIYNVPFQKHVANARDYFDGIDEISRHLRDLELGTVEPEDYFAEKDANGEFRRDANGRKILDVTKHAVAKRKLGMARDGLVEALNGATSDAQSDSQGEEGDFLRDNQRALRTSWRDDYSVDRADDEYMFKRDEDELKPTDPFQTTERIEETALWRQFEDGVSKIDKDGNIVAEGRARAISTQADKLRSQTDSRINGKTDQEVLRIAADDVRLVNSELWKEMEIGTQETDNNGNVTKKGKISEHLDELIAKGDSRLVGMSYDGQLAIAAGDIKQKQIMRIASETRATFAPETEEAIRDMLHGAAWLDGGR